MALTLELREVRIHIITNKTNTIIKTIKKMRTIVTDISEYCNSTKNHKTHN